MGLNYMEEGSHSSIINFNLYSVTCTLAKFKPPWTIGRTFRTHSKKLRALDFFESSNAFTFNISSIFASMSELPPMSTFAFGSLSNIFFFSLSPASCNAVCASSRLGGSMASFATVGCCFDEFPLFCLRPQDMVDHCEFKRQNESTGTSEVWACRVILNKTSTAY